MNILIIESKGSIETPSRYRNEFGQLLEHSPFCERDIKVPELQSPIDLESTFKINVRTINGLQEMCYNHHPFDLVGWDGYYFPWKLNINDFDVNDYRVMNIQGETVLSGTLKTEV